MKNTKVIFLTIILFIITSCSSKKNIVNVKNINNVKKYTENSLIYALPRTVIVVDIEVSKITKRKGPFSSYTEEFLGSIKNIVKTNSTEWVISSINFRTYPIVDTNNIYVISSKQSSIIDLINLTPEGLLQSINSNKNQEVDLKRKEENTIIINDNKYKLSYGELSLENTYKEVYDTIYRIEKTDTAEIKIPVVKKNLVRKSIKEQAKDLAEEIFILRDDKNALLVGEGDSEYLPEGDALEIMISGIEKIEKEYLSMFIGKTYKENFHYKFEFTPGESNIQKQTILFRFSSQLGILSTDDIRGTPVILQLDSKQSTLNIKKFSEQQYLFKRIEKKKNRNTGIYYRMPEQSTAKLLLEKKILAQKDILLAQYGTILSLPAKLFLENNYEIEFYPNYGSLKKISKK